MDDYGKTAERMPDKEYYRIPKHSVGLESLKVWLLFAGAGMLTVFVSYETIRGYEEIWYPLVLLLMPFLSTWIRRKVHSLILFFLTHLVMGAFVLLAPNDGLLILSIIYILLLAAYGMVRQMSKEGERDLGGLTLWTTVGIMLIIYILCIAMDVQKYETSLMMQGFVYTLAYLYYDHQVAVVDALKLMDKQGTMPTKRVIRFNRNVFGGYLLLAVLAMLLAYFAGLGNVLSAGGRMLMRLIRAIVGYFDKGESEIQLDDPVGEMLEDTASDDLGGMPAGDTSVFWVVLQKVMVAVFILFLAAFVIMLIVKLFKGFHSAASYHEADYDEYKSHITKVKAEKEKIRGLRFFDRSPETKIRREYFRLVRKKMDKTVTRSDTPVEVSEKLPEVKEIVESYEKVRYGKGIDEKA